MNKKQFLWALVLTLMAAMILAALSCNPLKKTQKYLFKHPDFSAEYCAEQYPVRDSIVVRDSLVIDTLTFIDQVSNEADTVFNGDTVTILKTNTVYKTITKTIRKDSIIIRRDAAEERRLQLALMACQSNSNALLNNYNEQSKQVAKWQGRARNRFWLLIFLLGAGTAYLGIRIKKYFSIKKLS